MLAKFELYFSIPTYTHKKRRQKSFFKDAIVVSFATRIASLGTLGSEAGE